MYILADCRQETSYSPPPRGIEYGAPIKRLEKELEDRRRKGEKGLILITTD